MAQQGDLAKPAATIQPVESNVRGQTLEGHREVRLFHELVEGLRERAPVAAAGQVDVDTDAGVVGRCKERKTLQVIHVKVADEQIQLAHALPFELQTEL